MEITKFRASNNVQFLLGVGHEVCISKICSCHVKTVEFPKKHTQSKRSESNNARINTVFRWVRHVSTSNEARLASQIMFHIKNKMYPDSLMVSGDLCMFSHIAESLVFSELVHF